MDFESVVLGTLSRRGSALQVPVNGMGRQVLPRHWQGVKIWGMSPTLLIETATHH